MEATDPSISKWKGHSCPRCVSPLVWTLAYLGCAQNVFVFACTEESCDWDETEEKDFDRSRIMEQ